MANVTALTGQRRFKAMLQSNNGTDWVTHTVQYGLSVAEVRELLDTMGEMIGVLDTGERWIVERTPDEPMF